MSSLPKKNYECSEALNVFEQTHYDKAREFIEENKDYRKKIHVLKDGIAAHHASFVESVEKTAELAKMSLDKEDEGMYDKHLEMVRVLTEQRMKDILDLAVKDYESTNPKKTKDDSITKNRSWNRS